MSPSSAPGRRFAKVGPQMGQFWAVLRRIADRREGSRRKSFHDIGNSRAECIMVPFPRTKKQIPV